MFKVDTIDKASLKISRLKNGVSCYLISNNTLELQIYLIVNIGSKNDGADYLGIAHYLEHMLLAFERKDDEKKGYIKNIWGCTNFEETVYHVTTTNKVDDIAKAAKLIKKIIEGKTLFESNLENVRKDIIEEWSFQVDYQNWVKKEQSKIDIMTQSKEESDIVILPKDDLYKARNDIFPYIKDKFEVKKNFPVGSLECIKKISFEDIKKFHEDKYTNADINLLVIGNVDTNCLLHIFEEKIQAHKRKEKLLVSELELRDSNKSCGILAYNKVKEYGITIYILQGQKFFSYKEDKKYNIVEKITMFILTKYVEEQLTAENYHIKNAYTETTWLMEANKLHNITIEFESAVETLFIQKKIVVLLKNYKLTSMSYYDRRVLKRMMFCYLDQDRIQFLIDACIGECIYKEDINEILDVYKWIKKACLQLTEKNINKMINEIINNTLMYIYCKEHNEYEEISVVERFDID